LATIFGMCFFQLFTTVPKYWRDNLALSENFIGFVMALNGILIVALEMVLIYILEQKKQNHVYIAAGVTFCGLSYFGLLLPGDGHLVTFVMVGFITIGEIISMPFMNSYWISRSNEKNRGQYAALYTMSWGIGQTIGPVICSRLVDISNFTVLFVVLGIALLLSAIGFYGLRQVYPEMKRVG
ncbi:MAG: MFS transporter, partial [Bacteroidia bacterium]|nr:MFS transporter [Bacteroidia bacterium]